MDGTKPMLASKGVWGSIIAIIGTLLPMLLHLLKLDGKIAPDDIMNVIQMVMQLGGAVLALWGRLTAKQAIG